MEELAFLMGGGSILLTLLMLFLIILWFILPFAIFGIKPLLRDMIANQAEIIKGLEFLSRQNKTLIGNTAAAKPIDKDKGIKRYPREENA